MEKLTVTKEELVNLLTIAADAHHSFEKYTEFNKKNGDDLHTWQEWYTNYIFDYQGITTPLDITLSAN